MKNIVEITFMILCCICITGCSSQETPTNQPTIIEAPSILHTETVPDTSTQSPEENQTAKIHFSQAGIEFDYPSGFTFREVEGEDGSKNEFTKDGTLMFWYEQGENWRVNMDWDKDSYQKILADRYPDALIDTFTKTTMGNDNIEMIHVIFYPDGQDTEEIFEEYIFINQYAFYDFYFTNAENGLADALMNSVNFADD